MTNPHKVVLLIEAPGPQSSPVFVEQVNKVRTAAEQLPELFDIVETTRWVSQQITPVDSHLLSRPIFAYGSIQFLRDIKAPIFPGAYGTSGTDFATASAHIPRKLWKNSDYIITTWADFCLNYMHWTQVLGSSSLFVRPVSDKKPFAGQVINAATYWSDCRGLDANSSVMPETLVVVAKQKRIFMEFRFFIVDRKIVTHTMYPGLGSLGMSIQVEPVVLKEAQDLAQLVADLDWQPDACYTCDVAVDYSNGAKLMELNSMSSAGVYDCDTKVLLEAIHGQAIRDFYP